MYFIIILLIVIFYFDDTFLFKVVKRGVIVSYNWQKGQFEISSSFFLRDFFSGKFTENLQRVSKSIIV